MNAASPQAQPNRRVLERVDIVSCRARFRLLVRCWALAMPPSLAAIVGKTNVDEYPAYLGPAMVSIVYRGVKLTGERGSASHRVSTVQVTGHHPKGGSGLP